MDLFSHILWVFVPTRNKLWRDEALFFAILPDISFALILLYVFSQPSGFWESVRGMPQFYLDFYFVMHSFVTLAVVAIVLWKLRPKLVPALSGWFIHLLMDIPFHEDPTFATRFLFPISQDFYIKGISWFDWRVLGFSYLALLIVYIYANHRDTMKMRLNSEWKPDIFDRVDRWFGSLLNIKKSTHAHEPTDIEGEVGELSGQDGDGAQQTEDNGSGEVVREEGG